MGIKQIIIIIVIIAAIAGAGVFAYMTFFSGDAVTPATPLSAEGKSNAILPQGTKLDFGTVQKFNKNSKIFQQPAVQPSEIGMGLDEIMEK
jgi:hypothetical protein